MLFSAFPSRFIKWDGSDIIRTDSNEALPRERVRLAALHEVEIKILEIDRARTEGILVAAGAEKIFDGGIDAVYFDFKDSSLHKAGGMLRLRREGQRTVLTFKKDVMDGSAKVREEEEVEVSDFRTMQSVLEATGLSPWLRMSKHRTTWQLGASRFEFDKYHDAYEYIPEFLEIEGNDVETVYRQAEMLGFSRQDCRPWDALEVAAYYSARRSRQ